MWFLFCSALFAGYHIVGLIRPSGSKPIYEITLRNREVLLVYCCIAVLFLFFWSGLGYSFSERYMQLKVMRTFERTDISSFQANVFSLIYASLIFTTLMAFGVCGRLHRLIKLGLWLFILLLGFLCASRRALIIPLLLTYLATVLHGKLFYIRKLSIGMFVCILWIMFGKEIIGGYDKNYIFAQIKNLPGVIFRISADMGMSYVSSLATVQQIDIPMRFGVDHFYSFCRRMPHLIIGVDRDFPDRIVRTTTALLVGPREDDVPPGLLGQAWLDFRLGGGGIYGLAFGILLGLFDGFLKYIRNSQWKIIFSIVIVFLLSSFIQTGSLDYLLGIETFMLALLVLFSFRLCYLSV
jgi:hypothetical protein